MREITIKDTSFVVVDERTIWSSIEEGTWEPHIFDEFTSLLKKDMTFLDLGAWIGPMTLFSAQHCQHCFAVEPDPVSFQDLKKNVLANPSINNVTLIEAAIADKSGSAMIGNKYNLGNSMTSLVNKERKVETEVRTISFTDLLQECNLETVDVIKMDIEAAEVLVLPTMISFLEKEKPILHLALHPFWYDDREEDAKKVWEAIRLYRYKYYMDGTPLSDEQLTKEFSEMKKSVEIVLLDHEWKR